MCPLRSCLKLALWLKICYLTDCVSLL
jgi:hypothetical protein